MHRKGVVAGRTDSARILSAIVGTSVPGSGVLAWWAKARPTALCGCVHARRRFAEGAEVRAAAGVRVRASHVSRWRAKEGARAKARRFGPAVPGHLLAGGSPSAALGAPFGCKPGDAMVRSSDAQIIVPRASGVSSSIRRGPGSSPQSRDLSWSLLPTLVRLAWLPGLLHMPLRQLEPAGRGGVC